MRKDLANGIVIVFNEEVYIPSDDTFILVNGAHYAIEKFSKKFLTIVELGCGTGYASISTLKKALNKGFSNVYAVLIDISPCATKSALKSIEANELGVYADVVQCDSASCLREKLFGLILFNPPYLPVKDYGDWLAESWSGGEEGLDIWRKFFTDSLRICEKDCLIVFVVSSLQNLTEIFKKMLSNCKNIEIIECRSFFYETICSVCCTAGDTS
jgi:release factor glutamine methyltransferase